MGSSVNPKHNTKCQVTKFASKPQKSTWPQTSFWTPVFRLSPSPSWLTFPSKEAANALEQSWTISGPYGTFGPNFSELWNNALDLTLPCLSNFLLQLYLDKMSDRLFFSVS